MKQKKHDENSPYLIQFEINSQHPDVFFHINSKLATIL